MKFSSVFVILATVAASQARVLHVRAAAAASGANLQTFTGALGGITATPVTNSGNADRPFEVKGDTFVNEAAALQRSCDQQFNACANAANSGTAGLSTAACSQQQTECNAAN